MSKYIDEVRMWIERADRDWNDYNIDSYRETYLEIIRIFDYAFIDGYYSSGDVDDDMDLFFKLVTNWKKIVDDDWYHKNKKDSSKSMIDDIKIQLFS